MDQNVVREYKRRPLRKFQPKQRKAKIQKMGNAYSAMIDRALDMYHQEHL